MTTRNDWRISLAAAVAASLFMAGCGSGGGGIDSPAAGAPPADTASGDTPPVEERLFSLPSSFGSLARALGLINAQISSSPTDHVPASRKNQIGHGLIHAAAGRDPGAAITPLEFSRKHPTDRDHDRALKFDTHLSYDALDYYLASRGTRYTGGIWRIQSPRHSTTVTVSTDSGTTQSARKRITTGPADRRNRTEEHVATAMGRDSSGNNTYRVEYVYPRADARPGHYRGLAWWILDSAESGTATTRWSGGATGRHGAFMVRGNILTANIENSAASRSGTAWTAVSTDYSATRRTDWLAVGLWGYRNDTAGATEQFGVFADGGEPFATPLLIGATGDATYRGRALGMYARPTGTGSNMATDFFTANATLTADFDNHPGSTGTNGNRGSIQGQIDNFRLGVTPVAGNPVIKLLGTTVGGSWDGVQFRGAAILTHGGHNHTGHWGGQFYGLPESGNQPEAVAGTFGVSRGSATGTHTSFVGAFDARR